jgi:adenine-specific DNA-methyltransferase
VITLGKQRAAAAGGPECGQGPPESDGSHAGWEGPTPLGLPGDGHLPADEVTLAAAAVLLGAPTVAGWSAAEQELAARALAHPRVPGYRDAGWLETLRAEIRAGADPLGEAFCRLRPPARRRASGQTFTPPAVISAMIGWAARQVEPARVVDPGTGSARFLLAAGRRWPTAELVGAETDPLAAMTGRAALAAAGMAGRATILLTDYRSMCLPPASGPALFLGNPPYVRHHQLGREWKQWLRASAARRGLRASVLAGLHVHFFLATAAHAAPGDVGVLVTAAEWLDVNYGGLVRDLLLGPLGGQAVHVLDPAVPVFTDAASSAAITCFRPGSQPRAVRLRRVATVAALAGLPGGTPVPTAALRAATRWGPLLDRPATPGRRLPAGHVELGELCRVHRGQVTGANKIWITEAGRAAVPGRFLVPAVTRASELFGAGEALTATAGLRCVIDLPADLAELSAAESAQVGAFLSLARAAGAADSYTAAHRTPWWRVGMGAPAPILATYMARRPPAFVRNLAGARHVNIAHGLYPRDPLPPAALDALAAHLRRTVTPGQGRTYAGGLTKFEPGEMERLPVPGPGLLADAGRVRSSAGTTSGTATRSTA